MRVACMAAVFLTGCRTPTDLTDSGKTGSRSAPAARVDQNRLLQADRNAGQWMSHGRDYSEQRFSPLTGINDTNVKQLGLAWYGDFDTRRAQEATPLVIDGVLY